MICLYLKIGFFSAVNLKVFKKWQYGQNNYLKKNSRREIKIAELYDIFKSVQKLIY
jgi:hypothetical protein